MGEVRDECGMHIVGIRGHVHDPHVQDLVKLFHRAHGRRIGLVLVGNDAGAGVKKPRQGRPGAAVLGTGHRMGGHIPLAARMVLEPFCNLGLGGADVHDDLVRVSLVLERVQHRMDDARGCTDRDRHHDDIAFLDAFLQGDHAVHQAQPAGRFRVQRILVRPDEAGGIAAGAQVHGQGPADQAQAHDSDRSAVFHRPVTSKGPRLSPSASRLP